MRLTTRRSLGVMLAVALVMTNCGKESPSSTPSDQPQPNATPTVDPIDAQVRAFADPILSTISKRAPDYSDDFSNPRSGWDSGPRPHQGTGHEDGEVGYVDGEYFIQASRAQFPHPSGGLVTCQGASSGRLPALSDFALRVSGRFVAVETGDWQIAYRGDSHGGYAATFKPEGEVHILRNGSGGGTVSLAGRQVPAMNGGLQANTVQIVARGNQMAVMVNGAPAVIAVDAAYRQGGRLGLTVCNFGSSALRVHWDNLAIWRLPGS